MPLSMTTRASGNILISALVGSLTLGPTLIRLTRELEANLESGAFGGLLLDLRAIEDTDSAGLGELVKIHQLAGRHHCRLALAGANPRLTEMLHITRLQELFACYPDDAQAESALRGAL